MASTSSGESTEFSSSFQSPFLLLVVVVAVGIAVTVAVSSLASWSNPGSSSRSRSLSGSWRFWSLVGLGGCSDGIGNGGQEGGGGKFSGRWHHPFKRFEYQLIFSIVTLAGCGSRSCSRRGSRGLHSLSLSILLGATCPARRESSSEVHTWLRCKRTEGRLFIRK